MKFVALISGGKDSIYSILECEREGHELVACVHLARPETELEESYMYQTAGSEVLTTLAEECLSVPLILHVRQGRSVNTSLVYESPNQQDEVEDLYKALATAKQRFPEVQAVSSGAILSTYQRVRIENVCGRLGLTSLSYLWRRSTQHELLQSMLDDGIEAVLVRTAAPPGLIPRKHLNKTLQELQYHFHTLYDKYQFHVCGEGGEYETLVLDCPLYRKRLVLDEVEIHETEDDGVGILLVKSCHAEEKEGKYDRPVSESSRTSLRTAAEARTATPNEIVQRPRISVLPGVKRLQGGLLHVSEIMSSVAAMDASCSESNLAVREALAVFDLLEKTLRRHSCTAQDVVMVHLYLSEMSHFAAINEHYRNFFGVLLPPSRSCVAVGRHVLPAGRRVLMDCLVQCGSGQYMRASSTDSLGNPYTKAAHATTTSRLRQVLHVQSISHWAPVCVGPYSQVNTLQSCLHFMAGQIGLIPSKMKLHESWTQQLEQAWGNVARVLDALNGGSTDHIVSGMLYISSSVYAEKDSLTKIEKICQTQLQSNAGIVPGAVDNFRLFSSDLDGYEDEETMLELTKSTGRRKGLCSLLLVSIPEMPVGALVEVEVIAATREVCACLGIEDTSASLTCLSNAFETPKYDLHWDAGHDSEMISSAVEQHHMHVSAQVRSIGDRCATFAVVTAGMTTKVEAVDIDIDNLFSRMMDCLAASVKEGSGFGLEHMLQIRLYYVATSFVDSGNLSTESDGLRIKSALYSCMCARLGLDVQCPAITMVPVADIQLLRKTGDTVRDRPALYAMQAIFLEQTHLATELWIHHGREE